MNLSKLTALLDKIPHAIVWLAAFVLAYSPNLIAALQGTPGATLIPDIKQLGTVAALIIAFANRPGARPDGSRKGPTLPPAGALCLTLVLGLLLGGCSPAATQTALTTVPADLNTIVCAFTTYEADTAAGKDPIAIAADELRACGQDAIAILTVIDGHVVSDMMSGKMDATAANARISAFHLAFHVAPPTKTLGAQGRS